MSVISVIRALFFKKKLTKSLQQSEKQTRSTTSNEQQTSSKDGANFEFRDGARYQNEEDVSYVLPNDYNDIHKT